MKFYVTGPVTYSFSPLNYKFDVFIFVSVNIYDIQNVMISPKTFVKVTGNRVSR